MPGWSKRDISYRTYIIAKMRKSDFLDRINLLGGRIYSKTCSLVRKTKDTKDFWLSRDAAKKYLKYKGYECQSHSVQAIVDDYFNALDGFFVLSKSDPTANPPYKTHKYHTFTWRASGISYKDDKLRLSMGKDREPLWIDIEERYHGIVPSEVKLVYNKETYCYEFHASYEVDVADKKKSGETDKIMAVDLGEIHPMTSFDGEIATIFNGRLKRHITQEREKFKAEIRRAISRCRRGSRRWKKLQRCKKRRLNYFGNLLRDVRHKITSRFVSMCRKVGIETIVFGDIKHIRQSVDYGKKANQKLHQWDFGKFIDMITYKAKAVGITVDNVDESYTSQTCPSCGHRKKPTNRNYKCSKCGWQSHRDVVGAINIFDKVSGSCDLVVGKRLAFPEVGVRYHPHLRRLDQWSPFAGLISSKHPIRK